MLCCLVIRHDFILISSSCITRIHIRHKRHSHWDSLCQRIIMDSKRLVCSSLAKLPYESYPDTLSWSEQIRQSQCDCLISGYVSSLSKEPYTDLTQNRLFDLATLWEQFDISKKKRFRETYGDIASLISIPIEEPLLWAALRFWNPSYQCFTFGKDDLVPTVEEYSVLIRLELQHPDKVYNQKSRAGWQKALARILKVQPQAVDMYLVQKEGRQGLPWNVLQSFIREHLRDEHGMVAFALAIYGLIIFPRG